jgi:hypothetical protein
VANSIVRPQQLVRRRRGVLALAALVLGVAGSIAWRQAGHDAADPPAAPSPARVHSPALPAPAAIHAPAASHTTAPFAPGADAPPLQVQVERLLATHDPQNAYRAYQMVANCATFNANGDRLIFDQDEVKRWKGDSLPGFRGMTDDEKRHDAKVCAGMTERERQNRLDYLTIAARAGVTGAAESFMEEGPFGDKSALRTRPDDPLVREWKDTVRTQMTRAAESGADLGALLVWQHAVSAGSDAVDKDPALAYRYSLAVGMVESDLIGPDTPLAKIYAPDSGTVTALAAALSPQQRAAELAAAQAIAERARAARKQARGG